jgi:predicted chitinase
MLISPPFLVSRGATQTEDDWLDACMVSVNDGRFPVSFDLGWHGGMHLSAPMNGNVALEVRAIADGTVVYVRQPGDKPADPIPATHAQMYRGNWTDKGVVVIRHDTEIGEGAHGKVSFFSVYMHLKHIESTVVRNRAIYRKAVIGDAGQIYGEQNRIHFEIITDEADLTKLVGRATGDLPLTTNGRADAVYGEMYVNIPVGAHVYVQRPVHNQPAPTAGAVHTTTEALIVGLWYAGGDGAAANRGDAYLTTYALNGTQLGAPTNEPDAEYNLYTTAIAISTAYPATGRPAPSAVYELLRFGRVLGPDALTPADVPHWRQVRYSATAQGWVNLNAANIQKFSDADFPQWKKWKLIDDDTDTNSRCESPTIIGWLDTDHDGHVDPTEAASRLGDTAIREKLKKTICKFPTEWETATIDARWGWLKTQSLENPHPMDEASFGRLKAHITVLCFWQEANLQTQAIAAQGTTPAIAATPIPANHWHWPPREFIRHFRRCGWLSVNELAATFPKYLFYNTQGNPKTAITTNTATYTLTKNQARARVVAHSVPLNQMMRKYLGSEKKRIALFLAQVMLETAQWRNLGGSRRLMHEWGFGAYSAANPATQYYAAFYGRGVMQLTWANNYTSYGNFRSLPNHQGAYVERLTPTSPRITHNSQHYTSNPSDGGTLFVWAPRYDPDLVGEDAFAACDSGGFYWISKPFSEGLNINRVCDREYNATNTGFINRLVNGGGNGYYERQAYSLYMIRYLTDSIDRTQTTVLISPPAPKNGVQANLERPQ